MSTGFELVPLALAAAAVTAAVAARRNTVANKPVWSVDTIIGDESLLAETLAVLGADHGRNGPLRYGEVRGRPVAFSTAESGHYVAHLDGTLAHHEALLLVGVIDAEYRRRVQARTLATIMERAPRNGLQASVSRGDPDGTVVVSLQTPNRGASVTVGLWATGVVTGQTQGLTGDACLPYEALMEQLADARTIRSWYTADYQQQPQAQEFWQVPVVETELE